MSTHEERPEKIRMDIYSGVLESLGINMYTSIGKSLVEFVANSFDADATRVDISIPFKRIEEGRKNLPKKETSSSFAAEFQSLPAELEISIEDNGHGMTVKEIEEKFLPISRNRREEKGNKSESGNRTVMGRKGLGKLAGFGAANKVRIWSKRRGETYATIVDMDFDKIKNKESVKEVFFTPEYEDDLDEKTSGTCITLSCLRGDSVKAKEETVKSIIARNFAIAGDDFEIYINKSLVEPEEVEYEFTYPDKSALIHDGLAETSVKVNEEFDYPILYVVKFRHRDGGRQRSLPAGMRGARIYCNKRLAAGPTLLNLETGMHNFHSQSYMECIVHADVLDQQEIDLIGTNRSDIKADNAIVEAFNKVVTELMKKALYEHSKYRDEVIGKKLEEDAVSKGILNTIDALSPRHRRPARQILKVLAKNEGIDSDAYKETAPMLVKAINSHEVLVELIKTGTNPKDLETIISQLQELTKVEHSDVLKLYRGRRHAILGLETLQSDSHDSDKREEKKLHELLKQNPWLINPEYDRFITSNQRETTIAKELTKILKIDSDAGTDELDNKRPDLVFVATDSTENHIVIVELKALSKPLVVADITQLEGYVANIEGWIKNNQRSSTKVIGHLIGNIDDSPETLFHKKIGEIGPNSQYEVITLPNLIKKTKKVHHRIIDELEKEEAEEATEKEG